MPDDPKLCECGCGEPAPLAEKAYTARGIKKGDPFRFINGHQNRLPSRWTEEDRGYATPCHIWAGRLNEKGYGIGARLDGRSQLAHRVAWQNERGAIPDGLCVLHRCDVPPCVNPEHLFLGTQADNVADMRAKGRERKSSGEGHGQATLTSAQVEAIRRVEGVSAREIAGIAGVSASTVAKIRRGATRRDG